MVQPNKLQVDPIDAPEQVISSPDGPDPDGAPLIEVILPVCVVVVVVVTLLLVLVLRRRSFGQRPRVEDRQNVELGGE